MDPSNVGSLPTEELQLPLNQVNLSSVTSATGSNSFQRIPSSNPRPTRELKVEDALLYLDQVKMEFSDKPHIYNEFLDIMKNFKAQSINTPGVIERVKTLFKGHNKLILGFNTFLPEGEGYKIELNTDDNEGAEPVITTVKVGFHQSTEAIEHISPPKTIQSNIGGVSLATSAASLPQAFSSNLGSAPNSTTNIAPVGAPPSMPSTSPPPGQMQQAHAFHYVTKIRDRFTNEPETYRSFLKILHTYQKEQKNIKEVLEQVSQLFADHADLLMEFTYFLPDAVQDQAKERLERAARESEARKNARLQAQKQRKSTGNKITPAMGMPSLMLGGNMAGSIAGVASGGGVGAANLLHGSNMELNLAGSKRGRNLLEHSAANPAAAGFPNSYAMQLAAHGLDESQLHLARLQPASKKQNLGASGLMAGIPPNAMGSSLSLQQQLQQQPQRKPRRKNAQGGNDNLAGAGGLMYDNRNMNDLLVAGAGGNKLLGYPASAVSSLSSSQQMLFGHHSQQSYLGSSAAGSSGVQQRAGRMDVGGGARGESHVSISAERRFFDQIKDVLMANSRDAWAEFVKCLELFTDDKINKDELLKLVEDLLHDHLDLFKEFQRLLENRVDYQGNKEDMWFSVPLSEIDFAQCRKCTPSYRALPRDYPRPKCSERNEEEEKFLNDVWVSIPIGSEESSSFKHMRKNQYEEALFKCEDERFEIDMIIDSNMSTIRVLEPLAEEILHWKASQGPNRDGKRDGMTLTSPNNPHGAANGMPRFSLQLEKRQLTTIHLNAISRIYGDHGEEILELLRKNPVGTIPVVLKRLKQKDQEWRRARHELNKHWKETVEKNHYKSFDHRSFYFRQNDKKYLSTKPLVQEIVTAAANAAGTQQQGLSELNSTSTKPAVSIMASLAASAAAQQASDNSHNAGVHYSLESDEFTDLLAGSTPHMYLSYSHQDHLVHRDIYRIVCHAAEQILTNPNDKERLAALWRDLLRTFFNIPPHYLYATSAQSSSVNSLSSSFDLVGASANSGTVSGESWPVDTKVLTVYGSGLVKGFREEDSVYEVQLPFGRAFVHASSILGAEQLSAQALYAIGVTVDQQSGKHLIFNGAVANAQDGNAADKKKRSFVVGPSKLFYGTQLCYVFLRLHHALYSRLAVARKLAQEMPTFDAAVTESSTAVKSAEIVPDKQLGIESQDVSSSVKKSVYPTFIGQVHALIEGSIDSNRFEDFCRSILGNKSYVLFTIDKIVHQLIKHLQAMANDDNVNKLIGLFVYHQNRNLEEGVDSVLYKNHVAYILSHTAEEIFRIQLLCPSSGIMAKASEVAIQHLGIVNQSALSGEQLNSAIVASNVGKGFAKGKRGGEAVTAPVVRKGRSDKSAEDVTDGRNEVVEDGEDEAMEEDEAGVLNEDNMRAEAGDTTQNSQDNNRDEGRSTPRGSGSKAPKAVVSDDDDEEEEDEEEDEAEDDDSLKNTNEANRKVVFSPRIR